MVEISFDTSSDVSGVALSRDGELLSEITWYARQSHSRDLLPALEMLLSRSGLGRTDISAVFVCTGPGSYAGLRVGLSTAKSLAYALAIPVAGVGRLAADAAAFGTEPGGRVTAVHAAGRAELAWATYSVRPGLTTELAPPRLGPREVLLGGIEAGDLVCGDVDEALQAAIGSRNALWARPQPARVVAVSRLGYQRLKGGDIDSADSLVPLYLREPAIGPQKPLP